MSDLVDELRDLHRDYVAGRWHQFDRVKGILDIAADALEAKDKEIERLRKALQELDQWVKAYPIKVFPEPDFELARQGLESVGITLDSVSASNMRHVLNGVEKIISQALKEQDGE